tara:strand:- start:2754 stop:3398 length:645 start_codon:yes stop_codon:yes gene_type:complete
MADYSHYPKALRPKSKKVKEKQRAQRQRVRSDARQAAARKKSKAKDKWGNVKQAVQDVRTSDAVALGATVLGRGRGGRPLPKGRAAPKLGTLKLPKAKKLTQARANLRLAKRTGTEKEIHKAQVKADKFEAQRVLKGMKAPAKGKSKGKPATPKGRGKAIAKKKAKKVLKRRSREIKEFYQRKYEKEPRYPYGMDPHPKLKKKAMVEHGLRRVR